MPKGKLLNMEKFSLVVKNIIKMIIWIGLLFTALDLFGLIFGAIAYAVVVISWSIVLTAIRELLNNERKETGKIVNAIFTTNFFLPFTAYGCYCSPKYGVDGRTNGLEPIDGLDAACKQHDDSMIMINEVFSNGAMPKSDYVKLKNKGDWAFMKQAITSNNSASGIYLLMLLIGFIFRIVGRSLA
jgi:hypothetical protein